MVWSSDAGDRRGDSVLESYRLAVDVEPPVVAFFLAGHGRVADGVEAIESALAMNNVTLVPMGEKFLKVVQPAVASQEGMKFSDTLPEGAFPENDGLVRQRDDLYVEHARLLNTLGRPGAALARIEARVFHPWEGGEGRVSGEYRAALLQLAVCALDAGDAAAPTVRAHDTEQHPPTRRRSERTRP